jgi:hypothetical protein
MYLPGFDMLLGMDAINLLGAVSIQGLTFLRLLHVCRK